MNYIIRKMNKNDCFAVAKIVTIAWNETYRGIVNDEFLDNLYLMNKKEQLIPIKSLTRILIINTFLKSIMK